MDSSAPCTTAPPVRRWLLVMLPIIVWRPNVISVIDGHTDEVCNFRICGRCDNPGHVVDNCPNNLPNEPVTWLTYGGTYSDNDDLNTLVDDN